MKKILAFLLLFCATASADQVILNNGDRLTGVIRKYDDQKLYIKTDYSGEITIKWSAISKVVGDKPLHIERLDASVVIGNSIVANGADMTIESTPERVTLPAKSVKAIRSNSEEISYQESLRRGWWNTWHGGGNLGFALARGNTETTNISLGLATERKTIDDKLSLYSNSVYAMDGRSDSTTANDIRGGLRYDRNLGTRLFGYGSGDFEHDGLQALTIRSVIGTGFGYHAINTKSTSLDLLAGGAYTLEDYDTGVTNNLGTTSLGLQYAKTVNGTTTFTHKAFVLPYLNSLGDYRATFDLGMATKISRLLTWQVNVSDHYVTNPLPTFNENDLLLTTGIGVTFGRKE
jgi:putative salt-induced outer membrane protein YdiY